MVATERYHRCPTCGHDWLECHGPGECKSVVFHLGDAKAWLPMDMICDDCLRATPSEACFVCGKALPAGGRHLADTRDGQTVFVGPECFRKIVKAGDGGYQPEKGGPRLWTVSQ